jgi:hypothetical protein
LVQAFLKKWWVESDFKAPNLPLSLRFKGYPEDSKYGRKTEKNERETPLFTCYLPLDFLITY